MVYKNSGQSTQNIKRRKRGHVTLRERILEMLREAPENNLTVRDFTEKLPIKREKVHPIKGGHGYDENGVYASQFYNTVRDLERDREIIIIPKRVQGKVKFEPSLVLVKKAPAGLDEISPILDNLKDHDKIVHKNAAVDFHELSMRKQINITPEISKTLRKILSDKSYKETWYYLLGGLWSILVTAKGENDVSTWEMIRENFAEISIKILSDPSVDITTRLSAIQLLGKLEVKKVLAPIFSIITKGDAKTYQKLRGPLVEAFCSLYPKFGTEIKFGLYRLLKNKTTQERADFILANLRTRLGMVMGSASLKEW